MEGCGNPDNQEVFVFLRLNLIRGGDKSSFLLTSYGSDDQGV